MEEVLKVGEITKPQGILGEVKIRPYVDDVTFFLDLKEIYVEHKVYKVAKARVNGEDVYLTLLGVADRNSAELLRGKNLFVAREEMEEYIEEDEMFIVDILGSTIILDDETVVGSVIDVTQANVDIFTVQKQNGKILRFPFLKDLLVKSDLKAKRIILRKERFEQVVCYED